MRSLWVGWVLAAATAAAAASAAIPQPLWQIGQADDTSAEFADYHSANPEMVRLPAEAKAVSKGLRGNRNPALELNYDLAALPSYGVQFSFKLLHAPKSSAQLAVFANRSLAGLVQLWGTAGSASAYRWKKTYRLYIPRELLAAGHNVLRLETARPLWSDERADPQIWCEWDYLRLEALAEPAREPIHGTVAYLGTTLKHSSSDFNVNDDTLRLAPVALRWMGVAYSQNTIRADFWSDLGPQSQPRRLEYLQLLRDLNLSVVVDHVSGSHFRLDPDGAIPAATRAKIDDFVARYGQLSQYYELGNEPCMFGGGFAEYLALARYLPTVLPPTVQLAAAGWAYGGGKGTPTNWDADPALRRRIERYCQLTNGHSYGYSYADDRGGSFMEGLRTYGGVGDGWPKEFLNTETGANNWHSEENGPHLPSKQPHGQAFDRILRAHLAVVDRTMQHAAIFDDFGLFAPPTTWADATTLTAYPGPNGEDPRLKTYRRLALAYATHGAPLAYTLLNREQTAGRKVYFRAVDTAALPALPGSGGASNKVLLNFVNFENSPQTLRVRVTLPQPGRWSGDRFGPGKSYTESRSDAAVEAAPAAELNVELPAGEAVQYILTPPGPAVPYAPLRVQAQPAARAVTVSWSGCAGATSYRVWQAAAATGPFAVVAAAVTETSFAAGGLADGAPAWFQVAAINGAGSGARSAVVSAVAGAPAAVTQVTGEGGDARATLAWPVVARATSYRVLRGATAAGPFERVGEVGETTFVDPTAPNGQAVWYVVRGINAVGEGTPSEAVVVTPAPPPAAPAGLGAVAGDRRVVLHWTAPAAGLLYTVKRAGEGGGFATLAREVAGTEFTDTTAANGQTWRYAVAAVDQGPAGADSAAVAAQPQAEPLPAPWKSAEVGQTGAKGSASYAPASRLFTVKGSGDDIWAAKDGGHFVYQPLAGDGSLTAHIAATENTHGYCKVGVMVRESLATGAPMALVHLSPNGTGLCWRATADGPCEMAGGEAKAWLRLTRTGDVLRGFVSADGQSWQPRGQATVKLAKDVLVGLIVCSHSNWQLNTTLFDEVALSQP